jgi:cytochrome P450
MFTPEQLEDPYTFLEQLRADDPVHQVPGTRVFLVSRHADILDVLARTDDFSNRLQDVLYTFTEDDPTGRGEGAVADVLATADDPAHAVHRHLVATAFTARRVGELEPFVTDFVRRCVEPSRVAGRIEWMTAVALPLPIAVMGRILGIPDEDLTRLQRWSDAGIDVLGGVVSPERMMECSWQIADWGAYHLAQIQAAKDSEDGITGAVARAARDGKIDDAEAASLVGQLVAAGSESTSSLIGSVAAALALDQDMQDRLRADPKSIPAFVEETLRLEAPFRGHYRQVLSDTELAGVALHKGDRLFILWSSANREAEIFPEPETVSLERANLNRHMSFGVGLHYCIGAPLARLEARVATEVLLASTTRFRLGGPIRHLPSLMVRRLSALALDLERPRSSKQSPTATTRTSTPSSSRTRTSRERATR